MSVEKTVPNLPIDEALDAAGDALAHGDPENAPTAQPAVAAQGGHHSVDVVRKLAVLALLIGGIVLLHHFASPGGGFDPRGLLALGFVVLAAWTIGELAEVLRFPHITGYLLAGVALGPSAAALLGPLAPGGHFPAPFDQGLLSDGILKQLSLVETLALPLIALTAGAELDLRALRTGIRPVLGALVGQILTILVLFALFGLVIGGGLPLLHLPGLPSGLEPGGAAALGLVLGAIALATSAAAVLAILVSTGAQGPLSRTILSVVVLKDVAVVVVFSLTASFATRMLGLSTGTGIGTALLHLLLSLLLGAVAGGLLIAYSRWIKAQLLLFLIGLCYALVYFSQILHAEVALVFITAGLIAANSSGGIHDLLAEVRKLSRPVFVVFFTLAGARLHLQPLFAVAGFALALVGLRMVALYLGVTFGSRFSGADSVTSRYAWLGMIPQAGLALSLASQLPSLFPGAIGESLLTLVLAAIALHELLGPALLEQGLRRSGETRAKTSAVHTEAQELALPTQWGRPFHSASFELQRLVADLEEDLRQLAVEQANLGPRAWRLDTEAWINNLRREFLRVHQRALADLRDPSEGLPPALSGRLGELGAAWKGQILARAARLDLAPWSPGLLARGVDRRVEELPNQFRAPIEPESLSPRQEGQIRRLLRSFLRIRNRFGGATREFDLQELARFHLSGRAIGRLEGVSALGIAAELRLYAHLAEIYAELAGGFRKVTADLLAGQDRGAARENLTRLRLSVEENIQIVREELRGAEEDAAQRLEATLGSALDALKVDLGVAGTFELPAWRRRFSLVHATRARGLLAIGPELKTLQNSVRARVTASAMELEIILVEVAVSEATSQRAAQIERLFDDLGSRPVSRADEVVRRTIDELEDLLATDRHADQLCALLKKPLDAASRQLGESHRLLERLREQLTSDACLTPLREALVHAADSLADTWEVPAEAFAGGEYHLPKAPALAEIPLRELSLAHFETELGARLLSTVRGAAARLHPAIEALIELERVLAFNSDLALAELEVLGSAPTTPEVRALLREMLVGAVGRSHARTHRLRAEAEAWGEAFFGELRSVVDLGLPAWRRRLLDGDITELRRRLLRSGSPSFQLVAEAGRLAGPLPEMGRALLGRLGGRDLEATATRPLRFTPPPVEVPLPVVYRRLFSEQALGTGELIVGREPETERLVVRLMAPTHRQAAIVGDQGTGKGAVASAVWRRFEGPHPVHHSPTAPVSLAEVESWFADPSCRAASLDGLGWLFQLRPGGSAPLLRFVELLLQHHQRMAWLITADTPVWRAACSLAPLAQVIPEIVQLAPLSPAQLEGAMLTRHAMSGYTLSVGERQGLVEELLYRLGRPLDPRKRRAKWFQELHRTSGGVVADALRLWLGAVRSVDESAALVRLGPIPSLCDAALSTLPDVELLILRRGLHQGHLSPDLIATAFAWDPTEAAAQLASLQARGLLQDKRGSLRVSDHLQTPLLRVLRAKGWSA